MPHKVTKTTTVFSLDELKEVDPAAHSLALDYLFERAEESWYSLDYPEVLNNFQTQNGQPDLTCDFNLEQHFATPSGYLKVPAEMSACRTISQLDGLALHGRRRVIHLDSRR